MKKYIISFVSVTTAMKAKAALRGCELYAEVARTPRNLASGCGYSVTIAGDIETALACLERELNTRLLRKPYNISLRFKSVQM